MLVSAIGYLNNRVVRESDYNNSAQKSSNSQGFGTYQQTSIPTTDSFVNYIKNLFNFNHSKNNSELDLYA